MPLPTLTVFDVETTGLDPRRGHRIIEIAGVHVKDGHIDEEHAFHSLVNPERPIPPEVRQIHRLTDDDLRSAPTIMTVLPDFLAFATGTVLVAQNAAFDRSFLAVEKEFCWGYIDLPPCLCTMLLSQSIFPTASRHNLDAICVRLNIPAPPSRHRALADVLLTASALQRLLEVGHIRSFEELERRARLPEVVKR